jgi:single-strand DNA-binding protein
MLNRAEIIGHLGADPEHRRTNSGDPIASFRVATTEKWTTKDGEKKEHTDWHSVVCFNEGLCSVIERFLRKGSKVFVSGKLQTRKWQAQDGSDRYTTEIVLQKFRGELVLLDKLEGNRPPPADDPDSYGTTKDRDSGGGSRKSDLDDDIPF